MVTMTISDARASLAEVVDQVRISGEPVYLTRRHKPVAALVDMVYLDALREAQGVQVELSDDPGAERERRIAEINALFAPVQEWFSSGRPYPASASDVYAARQIDPGDLA